MKGVTLSDSKFWKRIQRLTLAPEHRDLVSGWIERAGIAWETLAAVVEPNPDASDDTVLMQISMIAEIVNRMRKLGWTVEPPKGAVQ